MADQVEYLFRLESVVEAQLTEVIAVFQNLSTSKLLQPSSSGGWSIAECFEHLNSYAAYYHPKLWKALDKLSVAQTPVEFRNTWIGLYFIRMMRTDGSRVKYKAIKQHKPLVISDPHEVISRFIQSQEELLTLIKHIKDKPIVKGRVATSLSSLIKLNMGDTIEFLLVHNQRHMLQATRNLSD